MRRPAVRWIRNRRRRWLRERRALGLERPLPLAVLEVNCMSISAGPARSKEILERAAKAVVHGHRVDYILGCEADDFDAATVLGSGWDVHHDQTHPDKDGSFQAIRKTRGRLRDAHAVHASAPLPGVLPARWLSVAHVDVDMETPRRWSFNGGSGHAPPMRAWARWPQYMGSARAARLDVLGADFNKLAGAVLAALGRRVSAIHILAVATRWWIPTSRPVAIDVGGDHLAVGIVLLP